MSFSLHSADHNPTGVTGALDSSRVTRYEAENHTVCSLFGVASLLSHLLKADTSDEGLVRDVSLISNKINIFCQSLSNHCFRANNAPVDAKIRLYQVFIATGQYVRSLIRQLRCLDQGRMEPYCRLHDVEDLLSSSSAGIARKLPYLEPLSDRTFESWQQLLVWWQHWQVERPTCISECDEFFYHLRKRGWIHTSYDRCTCRQDWSTIFQEIFKLISQLHTLPTDTVSFYLASELSEALDIQDSERSLRNSYAIFPSLMVRRPNFSWVLISPGYGIQWPYLNITNDI